MTPYRTPPAKRTARPLPWRAAAVYAVVGDRANGWRWFRRLVGGRWAFVWSPTVRESWWERWAQPEDRAGVTRSILEIEEHSDD